MRFITRKKYIASLSSAQSKLVYGRIDRGDTYVKNLLNERYYYKLSNYPYSYSTQGWMILVPYNSYGYHNIKVIFRHPIFKIFSISEKRYSITEIRYDSKLLENQTFTYPSVKKEEVMEILGVGFNGFIEYNGEIDKHHVYLNDFRKSYDPNFSLEDIRNQINYSNHDN